MRNRAARRTAGIATFRMLAAESLLPHSAAAKGAVTVAVAAMAALGAELRKVGLRQREPCSSLQSRFRRSLLVAGEGVAFAHALNRCGGTGPDGKESTGWMRMTVGYRRMNGRWQVVHEHFSAPFDMETSKVLWLEP